MPGKPEVDLGCHRRTPRYNARDDKLGKEEKGTGLNVLGTTATRMGARFENTSVDRRVD
jgi:hypothetical protein